MEDDPKPPSRSQLIPYAIACVALCAAGWIWVKTSLDSESEPTPSAHQPEAEAEAEPRPEAVAVPVGTDSLAVQGPWQEVWGYLMRGEQSRWKDDTPLTDLALFDYRLSETGHLQGKPNRKAIARAGRLGVRTHLVIAAAGNKSLLHLVLSPRHAVRGELMEEILALPELHKVTGVQLDFEGLRREEWQHLASFAREVKSRWPPQVWLSLALPARTNANGGERVYGQLAGVADRLVLMVYDQHWRGSSPGPVSGLAWHNSVLECARANIPLSQLIVGLPFYGRIWQRESVAKSVSYPQVKRLLREKGAELIHDPASSNSFTYQAQVTAECWFEDAHSLKAKLDSARSKGFSKVAFWRLGQEDREIWNVLKPEAVQESSRVSE